MTWGSWSATYSNTTTPSTVAAAVRATATGTADNLFSGKYAYGAENWAAAQAAQWSYSELIQTPDWATTVGTAWNASVAGVYKDVVAGSASATAAAYIPTIGGRAVTASAVTASATGTARNATVTTPLTLNVPTVAVKIDWTRSGSFGSTSDVSAYLFAGADVAWSRGRSSDFSGEATGSATFTLVNADGRFDPDRQLCTNPSFEDDTTGWGAPVRGGTGTGASLTRVADATSGAGSYTAELVSGSDAVSGYGCTVNGPFRLGVAYTFSLLMKSISGGTDVVIGMAGTDDADDYDEGAPTTTGSWVRYSVTWTPSADHASAGIYVVAVDAGSTLRIDAIQVNVGASANTYIEGSGALRPGLPVLISNTLSGSERAAFYGFVQRVSWDPASYNATVTCYDVLRAFANTEASFSISPQVAWSARDYRVALLSEYERGTNNVAGDNNPSFEDSATAGWDYTTYGSGGATLTRVADPAPGCGGSWAGEWYAPLTNNRLRLFCRRGARFEVGTIYTASVWLKATSGTPSLTLVLGQDVGIAHYASQVVTLSTAWQQFFLRYQIGQTVNASTDTGEWLTLQFGLWAHTTADFTVRIDGLMVNRGPLIAPFSPLGEGRLPNMCANGSFDGGSLAGWYTGWANLCANPSFETDTTGWSVSSDSYHAAGTSITRELNSGRGVGSWAATIYGVAVVGQQVGGHYAVTGTFKAGVMYSFTFGGLGSAGTYGEIGIGSSGTTWDYVAASVAFTGGTVYSQYTVNWTPSADRTDVHAWVRSAVGAYLLVTIDGVSIVAYDAQLAYGMRHSVMVLPYATQPVSAATTSMATVRYGSRCQSFTTMAAAGSGRVYDFGHSGAYFVADRPYTVSLWINPSSDMAYRVGIGASTDYGATWADKTSTSGTALANAWTRVILTWTPSADRPSSDYYGALVDNAAALFVEQTDTTARTVLLDGVRVIPGSVPDEYELPQWVLGDEDDRMFAGDGQFADTNVGSGLTTINGLTLARHWVEPTLASPWYRYVTMDRDEQQALASSEAYADDNIYSLSNMELDLDGIANLVEWNRQGAAPDYVYDQASIDAYGLRPVEATVGILEEQSMAEVGAALLARKKDPHHRPTMVVRNRFASQLIREVNDVVTVSSTRAGLASATFNIQSFTTKVSMGGRLWETTYQLEEM